MPKHDDLKHDVVHYKLIELLKIYKIWIKVIIISLFQTRSSWEYQGDLLCFCWLVEAWECLSRICLLKIRSLSLSWCFISIWNRSSTLKKLWKEHNSSFSRSIEWDRDSSSDLSTTSPIFLTQIHGKLGIWDQHLQNRLLVCWHHICSFLWDGRYDL